jgi:hypothetical protein
VYGIIPATGLGGIITVYIYIYFFVFLTYMIRTSIAVASWIPIGSSSVVVTNTVFRRLKGAK